MAERGKHASSRPADAGLSASIARRLAEARAGNRAAFGQLVEPYRGELLTHCYRMLGSLQEAEEVVQETFLRAWRRLETFEGRAPIRAWLYRIATNACLDALARQPKRGLLAARSGPADPLQPLPPAGTDPGWLEPFPDDLVAPAEANPEARYDARESVTLAFLLALQLLPARQRAVLILRDVLDWQAREVAELLETSVSAVNSGLYRARNTLARRYRPGRRERVRTSHPDEQTGHLLARYVQAWEEADIDGLVSLLKEDASFPMPPSPAWYRGRAAIRQFVSSTILAGDARGRWRLLPVRANGQPAFGFYRLDEVDRRYRPYAIQVLTYEGDLLADVTTFGMPELFPYFDLPAELAA